MTPLQSPIVQFTKKTQPERNDITNWTINDMRLLESLQNAAILLLVAVTYFHVFFIVRTSLPSLLKYWKLHFLFYSMKMQWHGMHIESVNLILVQNVIVNFMFTSRTMDFIIKENYDDVSIHITMTVKPRKKKH